MTNILQRLPLKTLVGCKCVCKCWNHLISDPVFKSNYSKRNPQYHVSGFFMQKFLFSELYSELLFFPCEGLLDAAPKPSLAFIGDKNGVRIQHSCNGLLLCSSIRCKEEDREYYICKPTTKQYFPLPNPDCGEVFGINIAYDPNRSPHYKIVCIFESYLSKNHRRMKIFSPVTGTWKTSGEPFNISDEDMLFNRGVFWKGALHWIGRGNLALRFDTETELMVTMPMPPILEGWTERKLRYFGESGSRLFLIETSGPHTDNRFDVMEMKADYSGWFVKYHIDLDMLGFEPGPLAMLHISDQHVGDEDESFMVVHVAGGFFIWKLRNSTLMELQTENQVERGLGLWYSWEGVYPYSNTYCYL